MIERKELVKKGYVCIDGGFDLDFHVFQPLKNLSEEQASVELNTILKSYVGADHPAISLYEDKKNDILFYDNGIGLFRKIKSKFENSIFNHQNDREHISNVLVHMDLITNKEIKLGDIVSLNDCPYRIVWNKTQFSLFDDREEEYLELTPNHKLIKINQSEIKYDC